MLELLTREVDAVHPALGIFQLERASIAVGIRHDVLAARQRTVALLGFVADKPDHAAGLAVEAAPEAQHLVPFGFRAREPERRLNRLCTAAIQMSALEPGGRGLGEHPEGLGALGRGEGADYQPRGLARERLRQLRMAMAETRDRNAGEEIDEHVAVDVGERRALAVIERDPGEQRDTLAAGRDMALLVGEQRARVRSGNRGGDFRL